MSINDQVAVQISLSNSTGLTQQAMGVGMAAGYHTHWGDRSRTYTSVAGMAGDGFLATEPLTRLATAYFAQQPSPGQLVIGRRANPYTQVLTLTCTDATAGDTYTVTVVGSDGVSHVLTYTVLTSATTSTVAAALAALINGLSNVGTAVAAAAVITLTQASGKLTDLRLWSVNLQIGDTTSDPGITADLAAILAANPLGWYGVALDSNSDAEVEAAATWVEGTGQGGKVGFFDNHSHASVTSATTDAFSVTQLAALSKSIIQFSSQAVLNWNGASIMGYCLSHNPGSYTAAYKSEPTCLADTDATLTETQRLILDTMTTSSPGPGGKNGNFYVLESGFPMLWPGVAPSGRFFDLTIFLDWLQINVQAAVFRSISGVPKRSYTDHDINAVNAAIMGVLKLAMTPAYNAIDPTLPFGVVTPTVATVPSGSKLNRDLPGVTFLCNYTGAIQTVEIAGTVVP